MMFDIEVQERLLDEEPQPRIVGGTDPMGKTWRLLPYAGMGILSLIVFIASLRYEPKLWLAYVAAGAMLLFRYRAAGYIV